MFEYFMIVGPIKAIKTNTKTRKWQNALFSSQICKKITSTSYFMSKLTKALRQPKNLGIALGLLTILLGWLMPANFVEQWYSRGLFLGIRTMFRALDGWLPFAGVYLLLAGLLIWLGWRARLLFRKSERTWGQRILRALHALLGFAGLVVFLFQWLWGFNYGRVPLEHQMGISPHPLTVDELRNELLIATTEAVRSRQGLEIGEDTVVAKQKIVPNAEDLMRQELRAVLKQYKYPNPNGVRGRTIVPKGILLRFSTAGVYLPFTGEGHVDAGLHYLQLPFVLAHEMSHAYGHGDEGTCNFLAYLSCIHANDPYINYIGHLYYWRYVASEFRAMSPEAYEQFRKALPAGIRADVRAINEEMDKYPDILPELRDAAYNTYLQSQGIAEGMKNYDRVTMLVAAWRQKYGSKQD
ncbi:MAG: DUF3810 family protein [Bacteroidetes bacterium]|nr:DUF3810 family protein [Bacteroidota bacterium]